ncbi:hypothetical protein [Pulveribacter suum]|uniref:CopL family metal-binding regulatory protein n=1 Tax=Pulveribacter suum TaxID=2116657 RepID=A0A2P1NLM2_9BURK|nr:hypothetical protein [Pulveribacter suum]AVP57978.1 hypothetical protein C7H73_10100 [Pulveribacter suum]
MARRLTFLFMALLLVLRGLLGDAMAMPAPQPASTPMSQSEQGEHAAAAAETHCAGSQQAGGCGAEGQAGSACAACGLCHPGACAAPALAPVACGAAAPPPARSTRFASAQRARAIKPPIG